MKLDAKDVFKGKPLGDFRVAFVTSDPFSGVEYLALRLFDEGASGAYAVMRLDNCRKALADYMHSNISLDKLARDATEHHVVVFDPSRHAILETRKSNAGEILAKAARNDSERQAS